MSHRHTPRRSLADLVSVMVDRGMAVPVLFMLFLPGVAFAGVSISLASLKKIDDRTRIVLESESQLQFRLFVVRNPDRVVLELDNVTLNDVLRRLIDQVDASHPYLKPVQIQASPSASDAVQLQFPLKFEAEPGIRELKAEAGRGYQLILDIVPLTTSEQVVNTLQLPPSRTTAAPAKSSDASGLLQPTTSATLQTSLAQKQPAQGRVDNQNLVLLEMRLDDEVLAEAVTGYRFGKELFLPLGEIARLLTLAIKTQPDKGLADGFVLNEARGFNLNVAQSRLTLAGQTQLFDAALVQLQSDDIYVASELISRWLPIDFEIDLSSLILRIRPRERLPLQDRLERMRLGSNATVRTGDKQDPGYPRHEIPYQLLGVPFIDQTLGFGIRSSNGGRETSANYTAYLTGDLLGMESAFFVSSSKQNPSPDVRFTLGRYDPDEGLLGPLRARSVRFGSGVSVPSVANVANGSSTGRGVGLSVSNRLATQPLSFDRHTLRGDLPPGWDVELYFNEALVGFQASRPDGLYSFDDQPLTYGANDFRLVFHGPLGQQRVERQSFSLDKSSAPPGAFFYSLNQHQEGAGQSRSVAQFEWGLSKTLTATGGFSRLPSLAGNDSSQGQVYTNLGFRSFQQSFIFSSDFYRSPSGGWLNESAIKTGVGGAALSYSHAILRNFSSEVFLPSADPVRTRDKLRLDSAIPAGLLPRIPVTLELEREQLQSGGVKLMLTGRLAAYVKQTSISHQLSWQRSGGITTANGALQLSRRINDVGLSAQLGYSIRPQTKLDTVAIVGDMRLSEGYQLNLGLTRSVSGSDTLYSASLNKSLGSFGLGLSTSYSNRGVLFLGLQLFIAVGRDPRQGQWHYDARPQADSGAASIRVFLENSATGANSSSQEPIENVAITVNGSRSPLRTDAAGIAWLDRLPTGQFVDIAVDTESLEDPYWVPKRKGVRLVPRPGRVAELDFPIILTSEIDGTVFLVENATRRGIGDMVIELLNIERKVVSAIKSSSDGYYIVPAVPQGRYYLRLSPAQLQQSKIMDPGEREITILPNGKFISGIDFLLRRNLAETLPGLPQSVPHSEK